MTCRPDATVTSAAACTAELRSFPFVVDMVVTGRAFVQRPPAAPAKLRASWAPNGCGDHFLLHLDHDHERSRYIRVDRRGRLVRHIF
jgi:hypothetical protein